MNNLELNKFGVQELKKDEMMNVNGGELLMLRKFGMC